MELLSFFFLNTIEIKNYFFKKKNKKIKKNNK